MFDEMVSFCCIQAAKVPVKEYEFDEKKLANVQSHLVLLLFIHLWNSQMYSSVAGSLT